MDNIKKGKCPTCGKDGALILTIDNGDTVFVEVTCFNGCGHFVELRSKRTE